MEMQRFEAQREKTVERVRRDERCLEKKKGKKKKTTTFDGAAGARPDAPSRSSKEHRQKCSLFHQDGVKKHGFW